MSLTPLSSSRNIRVSISSINHLNCQSINNRFQNNHSFSLFRSNHDFVSEITRPPVYYINRRHPHRSTHNITHPLLQR
ncbi:hypothetical protein Hanom_Chr16g01480031 [Helianthus anomalus]